MPSFHNCHWHDCTLPESHSGVARNETNFLKNTLSRWQRRGTIFGVVFIACLPSEHQRAHLKQLRIDIIRAAGWSYFEIILLLSRPLAQTGTDRPHHRPQRWQWKWENGHASVNHWCAFYTSKMCQNEPGSRWTNGQWGGVMRFGIK